MQLGTHSSQQNMSSKLCPKGEKSITWNGLKMKLLCEHLAAATHCFCISQCCVRRKRRSQLMGNSCECTCKHPKVQIQTEGQTMSVPCHHGQELLFLPGWDNSCWLWLWINNQPRQEWYRSDAKWQHSSWEAEPNHHNSKHRYVLMSKEFLLLKRSSIGG